MGKPETLHSIKSLRVGGSLFIPLEDKDPEQLLRTYTLKCWREKKKTNKEFKLNYHTDKDKDGIKIKRTI